MTDITLTATITGTGADSTVPDNDGATDADIYDGETLIGCVTLLPDSDGDLIVWGPGSDCWADHAMQTWIRSSADRDESGDRVDAIEVAVRVAAEASS